MEATMNFLIVENSPTVKKMISLVIKTKYPEAKIVETDNGKEAFKALTTESFDLIITDLNMEDGDGASFVFRVKSNKILKRKKIIVFTAVPLEAKEKMGNTVTVVDKAGGAVSLLEAVEKLIGAKNEHDV
jgi:CheY-like chemotaxis protein